MNYEFVYNGETKSVDVTGEGLVTFGDSTTSLMIDRTPDGRLFLRADGTVKEIFAVTNGDKTYVDVDGTLYEFARASDDVNGIGGAGGALADPSRVHAPMPGKIVKLMVAPGDTVEPKQQLVIVEAMKMEHTVVAFGKGTVKAINFAEGDQCDTDTPIIELDLSE